MNLTSLLLNQIVLNQTERCTVNFDGHVFTIPAGCQDTCTTALRHCQDALKTAGPPQAPWWFVLVWGVVGLGAAWLVIRFIENLPKLFRHGDVPRTWAPAVKLWAKRVALCLLPLATIPAAFTFANAMVHFGNWLTFGEPLSTDGRMAIVIIGTIASAGAFVAAIVLSHKLWPEE
jgi:hypothetical protein